MNRVIKFRYWRGSAPMEYDVVAGSLGSFYAKIDPRDSASLNPTTLLPTDINPVMQFTGLYDKNGKEIYEGDIVDVYAESVRLDGVDEVAYREEVKDIRESLAGLDRCEVVGNIYENPELLS